jgi:hypothetical protein
MIEPPINYPKRIIESSDMLSYVNTKYLFKPIVNEIYRLDNIEEKFKHELKDEYRENNFQKNSLYDFFEILYKISYENDIKWTIPYEFYFERKKYKIINVPQNFCRLHFYLLKDFHKIISNTRKMKYLFEDKSFQSLNFKKKSKIINDLYYMEYFGFDLNYDDIIFKNEKEIFIRENKLYFFDINNNCLEIKDCAIDCQKYELTQHPLCFNNNHKIILKKFLKSFVFPILPSYKKDTNEKDKMSFRSKNLLLKIKKEINLGTINQIKDVTKNFIDFELDYEAFLKLPLISIVYFVKRWVCILWSFGNNLNSNLNLFPEKEIIIPYIKDNKVEWEIINLI